jgi:hypothetical protein
MSSTNIKIEQRQWLVKKFAKPPCILDCFCGPGEMWQKGYGSPGNDRYLGLDREVHEDSRLTIRCENRRYLRHVQVDLNKWDIFDLDAYGHPGEQLAIICSRLANNPIHKPLGFAITISKIIPNLNRTPKPVLERAGFAHHWGTNIQAENADIIWDQFFEYCFNQAGLVEVERLQHTESQISYYAIYIAPV